MACAHYEQGKTLGDESWKGIVDATTITHQSIFPPGILLEPNFVNVVGGFANVVPPPGLPSPFEAEPGAAIASDFWTPFDFAMPPILISPFASPLSAPIGKYRPNPQVTHLDDGDAIISWKIGSTRTANRQIVSPSFTIGFSTFKFIVLPTTGKSRNKHSNTSKNNGTAMLKACSNAPMTTLYKIWCGVMSDEDKYPFAVNNFTVHAVTPPTQFLKLHKPEGVDDVFLFCRIAGFSY